MNFCSDVQCLKSQTFFNSCAKNRLDFLAKVEGEADGTKGGGLFSNKYCVIAWLYNWGMLVSGVAGRPPKNICLRSISNFSVSGCAGYWNWRSHLRQIFFGVRPATPDTITVFTYWSIIYWKFLHLFQKRAFKVHFLFFKLFGTRTIHCKYAQSNAKALNHSFTLCMFSISTLEVNV